MVKLETVPDEHFQEDQPVDPSAEKLFPNDAAPAADEDDYATTDDDSSSSSNSDSDSDSDDDDEDSSTLEESIYERLVALKDMIPHKQRNQLVSAYNGVKNVIGGSLWFGGKTIFVLSTSALFVGVPLALAVGEEHQVVEMERMQSAQNPDQVGFDSAVVRWDAG
ncbi:mitochondrial import translocase, subunit Tom22 [Ascobolus immersus RN42]|uniref:Mitochondrial import translocase, subunit Tom22 n=1 Tax=Ascobolus immersus RN42 TaxID=1160509 RepID=A0A3N4HVM8_ASCIM|nr:mitochondrial import translocase, subunit Tom22 [Ascobolus immersus RN42]